VAADTPSPFADPRPKVSDPYDVLGFAPVFALDATALERRHRELSRALHPDRYVGRSSSERQRALGKAIEVNEAYRKLRDPIARAEALLVRLGRSTDEHNAAPASPDLLLEVMERREALGEARQRRDLAAVRSLVLAVGQREERVLHEMAKGFAQQHPDVSRVETLLTELRYHRRFLEEAAGIEDDLDVKPS
jgi:molecular chaperone HscB